VDWRALRITPAPPRHLPRATRPEHATMSAPQFVIVAIAVAMVFALALYRGRR
jgi:hypothetical protein